MSVKHKWTVSAIVVIFILAIATSIISFWLVTAKEQPPSSDVPPRIEPAPIDPRKGWVLVSKVEGGVGLIEKRCDGDAIVYRVVGETWLHKRSFPVILSVDVVPHSPECKAN